MTMRWWLALLGPMSFAASVRAQNMTEATRFFTEGRALAEEGKWEEACVKFEASLKAGAGTGAMLYLGDCYEKTKRPSAAWTMYRGAEAMARENQDQRDAVARDLAEKIAPRVSRVRLHFARPRQPTYELRIDDVVVASEMLDQPIPTDVGTHKLGAYAIGKVPWRGETVVTSEGSTIDLDVPPLQDIPTPKPIVVVQPSNAQRALGLIIGAVGLVSIGIGSYFGVTALVDESQTKGVTDLTNTNHCDPYTNLCNPNGVALRGEAYRNAAIADVTIGVGLAVVLGGVILYLTAPKARAPRLRGAMVSLEF